MARVFSYRFLLVMALVLGWMPVGTSAALPVGGFEVGDFPVAPEPPEPPSPPAQDCSPAKVDEVLHGEASEVVIDCNLTLDRDDVVTKRLILEGEKASGVTVDCDGDGDGATLNDGIEVRSEKYDDPSGPPARCVLGACWRRPEDVLIRNCNVIGDVRIWGMGRNDGSEYVRESSRQDAGHVARVRANAPRRITFDNMTITATGETTPFYVAPGVGYVTLTNSEITGESHSVGVYLDTESYRNEIRNNTLHVTNLREYWGLYRRKREELAIDNSSENKIINNYFSTLEGGGIYIYRNCGYKGVVRHGTPSHNQIINNTFYYNRYKGANPAIHIGSRGQEDWWNIYCDDDAGFPWGSSVDDRSFARYNVVMQNQFVNRSVGDMIKHGDSSNHPNYLDYNETVTSQKDRFAGCYVPSGYKNFILHGETIDVFKSSGVPVCTGYSYTCHDGNLQFLNTSACDVERVTFDCQVSGDNNGCNQMISCPSDRRTIVGAVAACNLEYGSVTDGELSTVQGGFIQVLRASDNESQGRCDLGGTSLRSGMKELKYVTGHSAVSMGCDEHDVNGGDCHIRAALYCR